MKNLDDMTIDDLFYTKKEMKELDESQPKKIQLELSYKDMEMLKYLEDNNISISCLVCFRKGLIDIYTQTKEMIEQYKK